jgi:hypothetical protein
MSKVEWKPFPALAWGRVLVCGIQEPEGTTPAYVWWHEDDTDGHGRPYERTDALMWAPWPSVPSLDELRAVQARAKP